MGRFSGFIRTAPMWIAVVAAAGSAHGAQHSKLWGENGKNLSPQSRLPDFSHAGYRHGEEPQRCHHAIGGRR